MGAKQLFTQVWELCVVVTVQPDCSQPEKCRKSGCHVEITQQRMNAEYSSRICSILIFSLEFLVGKEREECGAGWAVFSTMAMMQGFFKVFSVKQHGHERVELLIQNLPRTFGSSPPSSSICLLFIVCLACPGGKDFQKLLYLINKSFVCRSVLHEAHLFHTNHVYRCTIWNCSLNCTIP